MTKFAEIISTVFYIGRLPLAPGTWCSFIALLFWFVLIVDGMDFILANFPEEELLVTWITLGFTFLSPIISIIIYFMLWKTNFFTRNNS